MLDIIVAIASMFVPDQAVKGLVSTAPSYLNQTQAREHLSAALVAASITGTDPLLLTAIAYNESRYTSNVVAREANGLVSCGAMTPYPRARCTPTSLVEQYLDGARHLRTWLDVTRDERTALFGVAGGYALIKACKHGGPRCYAPSMFRARAAWIRRAIETESSREKQPAS